MTLVLLLKDQPAVGGVSQTLAGQADAASTLTGKFVIDLKVTDAATSTLAGAFAIDLKATAAAAAVLTGKFGIDLKGTTAGASTLTGAAVRSPQIGGTLLGDSTLAGESSLNLGLQGTSAGQSSLTGDIKTGFNGRLIATSTLTGETSVRSALAGQSDAVGRIGMVLPSTTTYPSTSLYPSSPTVQLSVKMVLAGIASATSAMHDSDVLFAGTVGAQSAMGRWQLPRVGLAPSASTYSGTLPAELTVSQLGQDSVLITLSASVDVLITLDADADISTSLMTNALLVTLGAS